MYTNKVATTFVAFSAVLLGPGLAYSADSANEADELQEVVITGSRLASGFDMPTPVAVYDAEELAQAAPNNMAEALGQLPSLQGSVQGSTSGAGSGNSGSNGQSLLNLRQMGANRTLILMDGQRMGVTNVNGSVDIGTIPQNLVKRVDIVTGGASASYGSDAVAGAVNFILDSGFEGLKAEATGGVTTYRDNKNGKLSIAYGKHLDGGRARFVSAMEYFKMGGMTYGEETGRYWFDHPTGAWANPTSGAQPSIVVVPNAVSDYGTYGGTITTMSNALNTTSTCPTGTAGDACRSLINQRFLPGGALTPMNFGTFHNASNTAASFAGGGDGAIANQPFTPDTLRRSFFLHGEFDLNPSVTLFSEAMYNSNMTLLASQVVSQLTTTQFTIFEGNAYLPTAINTIFNNTTGTQAFSLTRYDRDFGLQQDYDNVIVRRLAAGAKGRIGDRWTFDTTLTQQNTNQNFDIKVTDIRRLYAAADAVVNPANGQIVCRSTIYPTITSTTPVANTGMDPGCVPLNLYGDGAVSQAAADYVMGINHANIKLDQTTFDANLRGDFGERLTLGAGAISFATGVNWRRQSVDRVVDALSAIYLDGTGIRGFPTGLQGRYGGYQFYNPSPITGVVSVKEGYTEFGVPLLKDKPGFKSLAMTLAGRLSDYSQSGTENMWKLGLNWTLTEAVRLRGTLSADTRAPSVLNLFNTASVTQGRNNVPSAAAVGAIRTSGQNVTTGNPSLKPEHARTYTAGIVLSPSAIPGFQASLDWYKIKILDSITTPGAQTLIDQCNAGDQASCKTIIVNGNPVTKTTGITANDFVVVTSMPINAPGGQTNAGLDFAMAYAHSAGPGKLNLRLNGNYLLTVEDPTGCPVGSTGLVVSDIIGAIGGACGNYPKITGRLSANYDMSRFSVGVAERYIDKGLKNPNYVTGVDITSNNVPSITYTDLNFTYEMGKMFGGDGSAFLNVTNAFDKNPPETATSARSWVVPTEFGLYDVQGRRYTLGVRFRL